MILEEGERQQDAIVSPLFIPASNEPNGHAGASIWRLPRGSQTPPRAAGFVILKVMDNGRGISEDKLGELKQHMASKGKPGFRRIGITNVFNRIQLIYGDGYGGTIDSCEGMFTCVELRLPAGGEKDGLEDFTG